MYKEILVDVILWNEDEPRTILSKVVSKYKVLYFLFDKFVVWNKIYKTNKLNDLRFIEGIYFEDGSYTIQALHRANKVVTCANTYLYYFVNPNSIVKTLNKKKEQDMYNSSKFILNYIKENMQIEDKGIYYETFVQKLWRIKLYSIEENMYYRNYYVYILFFKILILNLPMKINE